MTRAITPEEDTKLPPSPCSSSNQTCDSDSDFQCEIETELEKKPNFFFVRLTSKALRVKRNIDHGLNTGAQSKKPKKGDLWDYVEQTLSPDLVLQVLPTPADSFVFRKVMTMKEVPQETHTQNIDNTLLTEL